MLNLASFSIFFALSLCFSLDVEAAPSAFNVVLESDDPRFLKPAEKLILRFGEQLSALLDVKPLGVTRVYLVRGESELKDKVVELGLNPPPKWAFGVCWSTQRIIIVRLDASRKEIFQTVRHELTHLFTSEPFKSVGAPLWFIEGVARFLETDSGLKLLDSGVRYDQSQKFFSLDRLSLSFPARAHNAHHAYTQSLALVAGMHDAYGEGEFRSFLIDLVHKEGDFATLFESNFGDSVRSFEARFRESRVTQERWHSLFYDSTLLGVAGLLLMFLGWRRRRAVRRQINEMKRLEENLNIEDAEDQ